MCTEYCTSETVTRTSDVSINFTHNTSFGGKMTQKIFHKHNLSI